MTAVAVYSYTHSVTYVVENILKTFKDILRLSGLSPANLVGEWASTMHAMNTWITSQHLRKIVLEIYNPKTNALVIRWDVDVVYSYGSTDGAFWVDTDQIKYAIRKSGIVPADASYRLLMDNKPGRPDVDGWSSTTFRSIDGMTRQDLGTTIQHGGLAGSTAYWRRS